MAAGGTVVPRLGQQPALNGVRAFAIAVVFALHAGIPHAGGGQVGVRVFFTLSGFLITTLLLEEYDRFDRVSVLAFYGRRAARLLPAAVLMTVVVSLLTLTSYAPWWRHDTLTSVPASLLYAGNWFRMHVEYMGLLGHTWSLSVEEQFYLLWPALLILAWRRGGRRAVGLVAVAGFFASTVTRYALVWGAHASFWRATAGTDTIGDQLLIGCALAAFLPLYREQIGRACRLCAAPAVVWLVSEATWRWGSQAGLSFGQSFDALASATVIGYLVTAPGSRLGRVLSWRPVEWLGRVSYGFYLWHYPILIVLAARPFIHHSTARLTLVGLVASLAVTVVSCYALELPVQRWLRPKFRAGRAPSPQPDAAVATAPA